MTTFSYTTGNPANLTAGATASMTDISGPFTDVKTFVNGANIDTTNLATSAKPVTLLGPYQTIQTGASTAISLATGTTYLPFMNGGFGAVNVGSSSTPFWFPLDPANHSVSGLTTQLRIYAAFGTNGTAPTGTWTLGLYPVTTLGGAANVFQIATVGAVQGAANSVAAPTAGSNYTIAGADFAFPSAGQFVFGVTTSANQAANSAVSINMQLQKHYV